MLHRSIKVQYNVLDRPAHLSMRQNMCPPVKLDHMLNIPNALTWIHGKLFSATFSCAMQAYYQHNLGYCMQEERN